MRVSCPRETQTSFKAFLKCRFSLLRSGLLIFHLSASSPQLKTVFSFSVQQGNRQLMMVDKNDYCKYICVCVYIHFYIYFYSVTIYIFVFKSVYVYIYIHT